MGFPGSTSGPDHRLFRTNDFKNSGKGFLNPVARGADSADLQLLDYTAIDSAVGFRKPACL